MTGAAKAGSWIIGLAAIAPIRRAAAAERPLMVSLRCRRLMLGQKGVVRQHIGQRLRCNCSGAPAWRARCRGGVGHRRAVGEFLAQSLGLGDLRLHRFDPRVERGLGDGLQDEG